MLTTALLLSTLAATPSPDLLTTADKTGYTQTGRYDEVERLCPAFERAFRGKARCFTFGTTPEGRPMLALAASADGVLDVKAARARKRPVVLFQGGIHAGEIDGKDAGFWALRDLLARGASGPLAKVTAVFVPVFNVDGHERFGKNNRPNQVGPEEMGWRTTAQNYNLNRDYVKADAPETVALLKLLDDWDPIVYADLHVTDGAKFQHDAGVIVEPRLGYAEALRPEGAALSDALDARLEHEGFAPLPFYPAFREYEDPGSGIALNVPPPRFGHGYWAARNRIGILLETHSWKPYAHRVKETRAFLVALLDLAAERGPRWREAAARADTAPLAGRELVVDWKETDHATTFAFRGYAYVREPSPISGRLVTRYDDTRPELWNLRFFDTLRPETTVSIPRGGWIVPAAHAAWVAEKLRLHGVRFERLDRAVGGADVEAFRATEATFDTKSFEGRVRLTVKGGWAPERRDVPAGSLWVPSAQPGAVIAANLLEPLAPDSLVAWGFFDTAFERKEYIESYVIEDWARDLLERDPAVRAEFTRRLGDPEFAKSAEDRLRFFHERHPSWDERYRLYPVLRAGGKPGEPSGLAIRRR